MNVLEGKKAFTLKSSYKEHAYGYNPSEEVSVMRTRRSRVVSLAW